MSGVPAWARVGARCVCVRLGKRRAIEAETMPALGQLLTIRDVVCIGGEWALRFAEIVNAPRPYVTPLGLLIVELAFDIPRFRPLVTRTQQQDIAEHFAGHLRAPVRQPAGVDA